MLLRALKPSCFLRIMALKRSKSPKLALFFSRASFAITGSAPTFSASFASPAFFITVLVFAPDSTPSSLISVGVSLLIGWIYLPTPRMTTST